MTVEEAVEICTRWRTDLAYTPPETENWRWSLIAEELLDLVNGPEDA